MIVNGSAAFGATIYKPEPGTYVLTLKSYDNEQIVCRKAVTLPCFKTVVLINTTNVEVFVDGKKVEYPPLQGDTLTVTLHLTLGTHELKVISKDGFVPFIREIDVVSDKTPTIRVNLKKK